MRSILLVFLVIFFLATAPAISKDRGWSLAYNFHGWGDLDALVFRDCARIEDKLRSWVMVLNKPGWQITCYSPQRKTIVTMPLSAFKRALGERLGIMTASDVIPAHWKKIGPANVNGISAIRYDQIVDTSTPNRVPTSQYYVAGNIQVAPEVARFLCKVYDQPDFNAVPIRMTKRRVKKLKLDTRSIKPAVFKPDDFKIPRGFKTKTLEEVMFANTSFY
jgi:hypothetical protein